MYNKRFRFSNMSAMGYTKHLKARADEAAVMDPSALAERAGDDIRRAEVVTEFRAKWSEVTTARRNQRTKAADVEVPSDGPVVAPGLTDEFPLGRFSSKKKCSAELVKRGVEHDEASDPLHGPDGLKAKLRAYKGPNEVFVHPLYKKEYMKRLSKADWDTDSESEREDHDMEDAAAPQPNLPPLQVHDAPPVPPVDEPSPQRADEPRAGAPEDQDMEPEVSLPEDQDMEPEVNSPQRPRRRARRARDQVDDGAALLPGAAVLTESTIKKMAVSELRRELRVRDLSTDGLKKELRARLAAAVGPVAGQLARG